MNVVATTTAGRLRGAERPGVLRFRGVPFAHADRFRPPVAVEPWDGVRDALAFGPSAPQIPGPTEVLLGAADHPTGEDCLVLNVTTPALDDARRPVMVWFHGGGYVSGSARIPWYDGAPLARAGDVVVVTANYRLGALGYLHLGHLVPELAGSGANGTRDQVAALRWVRDNIVAFGGDPGNVTIFGESAGAMSVGTLLGTPDATGLFHRAVAQSGASSNVHRPPAAEWVAERFLVEIGLEPRSAEAVVDLPLAEVLRAQTAVATEVMAGQGPGVDAAAGMLTFQPVVDGTLLPEPPLDAVRAGSAAGVTLVAGTTADEWNLFHLRVRQAGGMDERQVHRRLARMVGGDRVADVMAAYRAARPGADLDTLVCALMTDRVFRLPAIRLAEAQVPHAPRVAMYRFDHPSVAFGNALGACHGIEIPFVFGTLARGGTAAFLGEVDDASHALSDRCVRAWTGVARTGDPTHDDLAWPAYDLDRRATAVLDRSPTVLDDPGGELRRLWDEIGGIAPS